MKTGARAHSARPRQFGTYCSYRPYRRRADSTVRIHAGAAARNQIIGIAILLFTDGAPFCVRLADALLLHQRTRYREAAAARCIRIIAVELGLVFSEGGIGHREQAGHDQGFDDTHLKSPR